jgi:uncharacterized phiE125 gp8 family phage protein
VGLTLLTPPTTEPISVDEAKLHLREPYDAQDTLIQSLIIAVREHVEFFTRRALAKQSWRLSIDEFPCNGRIRLPMPPLSAVTSIKYTDLAGAEITLDPSQYVVDLASLPGKIDRAYNVAWPSTRCQPNAVRIEFDCGYSDAPASIPEGLKAGMKLWLGHLYENREAVNIGNITSELPLGVKALLWPYRVLEAV